MRRKRNWIIGAVAALFVIGIIAGRGEEDGGTGDIVTAAQEQTEAATTAEAETEDGAEEYPSGNPEVYRRIGGMTDCAALQAEFDQADENRGNQPAGSEQAEWSTNYMMAADDRMREVGCYD